MFALFAAFCICKQKFALVVDAGSSHTSCMVYTWEDSKDVSTPDISIYRDGIFDLNIKLSSAGTNESLIPRIFNEFIEKGSKLIPATELSRTRMMVYATAGMRLLDPVVRDSVMEKVYQHLEVNSPFLVKREYVRVIDGYEEGLFGWLTANMLTGHLKSQTTKETGYSDMGGASLEITYETNATAGKNSHIYEVTVGKNAYNVVSYSYLNYGGDRAAELVTDALGEGNQHPCMLKGYIYEQNGRKYEGTGELEQCIELVNKTMIESDAFTKIVLPDRSGIKTMIGVSVFSIYRKFFAMNVNATLEDWKRVTEMWSAQTWEEASAKYPNDKYVPGYMLRLCYIKLVLEGWGFRDDNVEFMFPDEINGMQVGWTAGALMTKVWDIHIVDAGKLSKTAIIIVNVVIFVCMIPLALLYLRPWKKFTAPVTLVCP